MLLQYKAALPQQLMDVASVLHEYLLVRGRSRLEGPRCCMWHDDCLRQVESHSAAAKTPASSGCAALRSATNIARSCRLHTPHLTKHLSPVAPLRGLAPGPALPSTHCTASQTPAARPAPTTPQDLSEVPDYQDATARLCSTWWLLGAPGKEHLIASTVPYVVMKAVEGGKAADVKAAFQLRHAMALYDWDDDSINDLKGMLLRCAISPAFLRRPDGRRLVGFLFTLHPQMVRELTSVIRNQVSVWGVGEELRLVCCTVVHQLLVCCAVAHQLLQPRAAMPAGGQVLGAPAAPPWLVHCLFASHL